MKLGRIKIDKYGPLIGLDISLDSEFQCMYGPNESGKTLIIDAILKSAFGKRKPTRIPSGVNRVVGGLKGWITILDGSKETVIDESKSLANALNVSTDELINIFVIRNSDLDFLDEKRCLSGVTEKILGLSSRKVAAVQMALREKGRLTKTTGQLRTSGDDKSPSKQRDKASKLIQDISEYLDKTEEEGVAQLEAEFLRLEIKRSKIEEQVSELEAAQKLARHTDMSSQLTQIYGILADEENLPESKVQGIRKALQEFEDDISQINKLERGLHIFRLISIISYTGLTTSAVLALLLNEGVVGILQSLIVAVAALIMTAFWIKHSQNMAEIEKRRVSMITLASEFDSECEDLSAAKRILEETLKNSENTATRRAEAIGSLKTHLGIDKVSDSKVIEKAETEIDRLKKIIDFSVKCAYKLETLEEKKAELEGIKEEIKNKKNSVIKHRDNLSDFEKRATKINFEDVLGESVNLYIGSNEALDELKKKANQLVLQIDSEADLCSEAIKVFDLILRDEHEQISELLSKGSRASEVFQEITDGNYTDLVYDTKKKSILAKKHDGKTFRPEELSKGTKDQLYLSVRIALGERLLKGEKGFFVMDDPFITSDVFREKREAQVLKHLVNNGWQVIFFTARKQLAETLSNDFEKQYIELNPL